MIVYFITVIVIEFEDKFLSYLEVLCIPFWEWFLFIEFCSRHYDRVVWFFILLTQCVMLLFDAFPESLTKLSGKTSHSSHRGIFCQPWSQDPSWLLLQSVPWSFTYQSWFFQLFCPLQTFLRLTLWQYLWRLSKSFSYHRARFPIIRGEFIWKL